MPRIRMVKPEFFDDPAVGDLPLPARLFFIGLWTQADREGRLVEDVRQLKARLFPYDAVEIRDLIVELQARRMLCRYEAVDSSGERRRYLWIRNFTKHQRPHPKEPASVIPPCPTSAVEKHCKPCKKTASPSESGFLILDSGSLDSGSLDSGTRNLESGTQTRAPARAASGRGVSDGFEEFWEAYPKKKAKNAARKAWEHHRPDGALRLTILAAIAVQRQSPDWQNLHGRFIPYPATWLNRGQWMDVTAVPVAPVSDRTRQNLANRDEARRLIQERTDDSRGE